MDAIQTPRDARLSINQGEAWLRRNQDRFHPTDRYILRILFEYAHTPVHAMALRDEITRRVISESSPANPSPHHGALTRPVNITINPAHRGHDMTDDTTDAAHPLQGAGAF